MSSSKNKNLSSLSDIYFNDEKKDFLQPNGSLTITGSSQVAIKKPRACRVLQGFEPAFAGGPLLENAALAQAYRVIFVRSKPV